MYGVSVYGVSVIGFTFCECEMEDDEEDFGIVVVDEAGGFGFSQ
jgi:hypothetical protein